MDSGFYVAYGGLASRMQALDVVASNMANASTAGFKAQTSFYQALYAAQSDEILTPLNQAVNRFGILGGSLVDMSSGSLESTGNNLDLAMEGAGFFSVQTNGGVRYTRNGSFRLNAARQITTQDGNFVLADQGKTTVPITLPTGSVSISPDGTISVDGGLVAKLHIVQFAPGALIEPEGDSKYVAPPGSEMPSADSRVRQGMLETSNINPVKGAVGLILLQRQAELLGRALSIFSSDFNRAAVQDVPHV